MYKDGDKFYFDGYVEILKTKIKSSLKKMFSDRLYMWLENSEIR